MIDIRRPWMATALLSFVAGYVDTVGFVALFSLFTAHVTGNFVLIGATLGDTSTGGSGLLAKLLALPCFVAAVALSTLMLRRGPAGAGRAARSALKAQAALVVAFMASGMAAQPLQDGATPLALLTGMLGVCAMAVQNAASRIVFTDMPPTTVMTGNVTQLVIDSVELLRDGATPSACAARGRIARMLPAVLAFAVGALSGGFGYHSTGFGCLVLAVLALGVAIAVDLPSTAQGTGVSKP